VVARAMAMLTVWVRRAQDWPPSTDFKTAFPELYEDFAHAVPVPSYTRRDGAYNIASHFPSNTIAPDLGTARRVFFLF
jgi:[histone H3]-dimethyl-L-lysine9 demethylase